MAQFCSYRACLRLPEWTECCQKDDDDSTKIGDESKNIERFNSFVTEEEADRLAAGFVPKNTEKSTKWALRNFEAWLEARNLSVPGEQVPHDLLQSDDPTLINKWFSRFVMETRNSKGESYSPSSINQLLAGLLRHMCSVNPNAPNFLDKKNTHFSGLHGTLDNLYRSLHEIGIGRKTKHAEVITKTKKTSFGRAVNLVPEIQEHFRMQFSTTTAKRFVFVVEMNIVSSKFPNWNVYTTQMDSFTMSMCLRTIQVHSGRITFLKRKFPFMLVLKLEIGVTFICSLCI